jgi:hypothetical protein
MCKWLTLIYTLLDKLSMQELRGMTASLEFQANIQKALCCFRDMSVKPLGHTGQLESMDVSDQEVQDELTAMILRHGCGTIRRWNEMRSKQACTPVMHKPGISQRSILQNRSQPSPSERPQIPAFHG